MFFIVIVFYFILMPFGNSKILISFKDTKLSIYIILFKVIKMRYKAKTNKGTIDKNTEIRKPVKRPFRELSFLDMFQLIRKSQDQISYLISKIKMIINLDFSFFLISVDKTAIAYGVFNCVIYRLHKFFENNMKKYNGSYKITPDFNNTDCNIFFECIISIRNFYILIFMFKMLPIILQYKKIIKSKGSEFNGSSNRRFNENYNG